MDQTRLVLLAGTVGLALLVAGLLHRVATGAGKSRLPLPPGPKGYPLINNLLDQPKSHPWRTWLDWTRKYGPVFSLRMPGGQVFVVLGTHKAASDLLDKRGALYSDRPRNIVAGEYGTGGKTSLFMPHGPQWRTVRKLMHHGLNIRAAESYQPIQTRESKVLLHDLLADPSGFERIFHRYTTSNIIEIVYGRRVSSSSDRSVGLIKDLVGRLITSAQPGAHMVDYLPVLDYLPDFLSGWRIKARALYSEMSALFVQELQAGRERVARDDSLTTFIKHLDEAPEKDQTDEVQKAFIAGDLYAAGAETTAGVMVVFVMAMALHPQYQTRAWEELDRVVGPTRLPTFDDWDRLPYVRAIISELHRWRPVGPIGFPRRVIQDDEYEGHRIPKGAMIIYNTWAINRNAEFYPDPEVFHPDRFLTDPPPPQPYPFASGRRVCPGRDVASRSLFIVIASLLATMRVERALDAASNEVAIDPWGFVDSGVSYPLPFEAQLRPRSEAHARLVRAAYKEVEEQL